MIYFTISIASSPGETVGLGGGEAGGVMVGDVIPSLNLTVKPTVISPTPHHNHACHRPHTNSPMMMTSTPTSRLVNASSGATTAHWRMTGGRSPSSSSSAYSSSFPPSPPASTIYEGDEGHFNPRNWTRECADRHRKTFTLLRICRCWTFYFLFFLCPLYCVVCSLPLAFSFSYSLFSTAAFKSFQSSFLLEFYFLYPSLYKRGIFSPSGHTHIRTFAFKFCLGHNKGQWGRSCSCNLSPLTLCVCLLCIFHCSSFSFVKSGKTSLSRKSDQLDEWPKAWTSIYSIVSVIDRDREDVGCDSAIRFHVISRRKKRKAEMLICILAFPPFLDSIILFPSHCYPLSLLSWWFTSCENGR